MKRINLFAFAVLLLTGCTDNVEQLSETNDSELQEQTNVVEIPNIEQINFNQGEEATNNGINQFGISFLNLAAEMETRFKNDVNEPDGNLAVSPLSAAIALSLAANTCDDATEKAISEMLGFPDIADLNSTINQLMRFLPCYVNGIGLELANAVFYNKILDPSQEWETNLRNNLYSLVSPLDFADSASVDFINNWCSDNTHGMIPNFLYNLDSSYMALLLNAMYFAGVWNSPFNKEMTTESEFYSRDNGTQTTEMMCQEGSFGYVKSDGFQIVAVPFKGNTTKMVLMLPNEVITSIDLAKTLSSKVFYEALDNLQNKNIVLRLPKFSISTSSDITGILNEAGLPTTVTLTKMGLDNDVVLLVKQKTATTIDEEGAEVAAVTAVSMIDTAFIPEDMEVPEKLEITFDRPFLYFFINKKTGTILMAGVINNI